MEWLATNPVKAPAWDWGVVLQDMVNSQNQPIKSIPEQLRTWLQNPGIGEGLAHLINDSLMDLCFLTLKFRFCWIIIISSTGVGWREFPPEYTAWNSVNLKLSLLLGHFGLHSCLQWAVLRLISWNFSEGLKRSGKHSNVVMTNSIKHHYIASPSSLFYFSSPFSCSLGSKSQINYCT